MSIMSLMMRIMSKRNDAKRDAGLVYPEDVIRSENISYGPHKMNVLDVYRPAGAAPKLPVIVSVHGGGWVYGDKELYSHYCVSLAKRGFVVVNFTYRLSPENKFPCHLEDTVLVFDWVKKNATRFGMDRENIFAVGDSAGGHILSLYCSLCAKPEYAQKFEFQSQSKLLPKAIALNCAVLDLDAAKDGLAGASAKLMKDILPNKGKDANMQLLNPIAQINENYPPCLLMTSNEDFLRTQPDTFMEELKKHNVSYTYKFYGNDLDKLGHVFHLDMRNETGKLCNDEQCAYFKSFM